MAPPTKPARKVSPKFPDWLPRTEPPRVNESTLRARDTKGDPHLNRPSPEIPLEMVREDKDYIYINGGVLYDGNHAASYFGPGFHNQGMAWCNNGKCIPFDAYNKTYLANKELPIGTVVGVMDLTDQSREIRAAVTTRGPYYKEKHRKKGAVDRDFDLSKKAMFELTNGNLRQGMALPVQVIIYAVPKVYLAQCGDEPICQEGGALALFKDVYDLLRSLSENN